MLDSISRKVFFKNMGKPELTKWYQKANIFKDLYYWLEKILWEPEDYDPKNKS